MNNITATRYGTFAPQLQDNESQIDTTTNSAVNAEQISSEQTEDSPRDALLFDANGNVQFVSDRPPFYIKASDITVINGSISKEVKASGTMPINLIDSIPEILPWNVRKILTSSSNAKFYENIRDHSHLDIEDDSGHPWKILTLDECKIKPEEYILCRFMFGPIAIGTSFGSKISNILIRPASVCKNFAILDNYAYYFEDRDNGKQHQFVKHHLFNAEDKHVLLSSVEHSNLLKPNQTYSISRKADYIASVDNADKSTLNIINPSTCIKKSFTVGSCLNLLDWDVDGSLYIEDINVESKNSIIKRVVFNKEPDHKLEKVEDLVKIEIKNRKTTYTILNES